MPNHVHAILRPLQPKTDPLEKILQSRKRRTSREINSKLGLAGELWQEESFDRIIRDEEHLDRCLQYIGANPRRGGLSADACPRWAFISPNAARTAPLIRAVSRWNLLSTSVNKRTIKVSRSTPEAFREVPAATASRTSSATSGRPRFCHHRPRVGGTMTGRLERTSPLQSVLSAAAIVAQRRPGHPAGVGDELRGNVPGAATAVTPSRVSGDESVGPGSLRPVARHRPRHGRRPSAARRPHAPHVRPHGILLPSMLLPRKTRGFPVRLSEFCATTPSSLSGRAVTGTNLALSHRPAVGRQA